MTLTPDRARADRWRGARGLWLFLAECWGDETAWTEWHWAGTQHDGAAFDWHGVLILGVQQDQIAWARLYMEPTDTRAEDIDATVQTMTGRANDPSA